MLQVAKDLIGWDKWQAERAEAHAEGRWFGIGIGTTLDSGTNNFGQSQIVNPQAPFSGNSQAASAKLDHLRRSHRRRRLCAARSGSRDHGLAGRRRHPEHLARTW